MNKIIVTVIATLVVGSAMAKPTPIPPQRPFPRTTVPAPTFNTDPNVYGAVVKDGQVVVRAPLGSDVQVDVDGNSFTVDVDRGKKSFVDNLLPWKW